MRNKIRKLVGQMSLTELFFCLYGATSAQKRNSCTEPINLVLSSSFSMPPKPEKNEKPEKPNEEILTQLHAMRLTMESNLQSFIHEQVTTHMDTLRDQLAIITQTNQKPSHKTPKIHLLPFDGSNPLDWIFQTEHYFELNQIPQNQRLTQIPFYMQDPVLGWFKWLHTNNQLTTWSEFTRSLELRFGPSTFENHQATLFKLKQTGTVMDYQLQFETLSNRVVGMSEELLRNCFISGLRNDIQREMAVLKPESLAHTIGLAKLLEAKFHDSRPAFNRFPRSTNTPQSSPSILGPAPSGTIPIRQLSPAEWNERKAKGLCFNCDEKWVTGHRGQSKKFLLLLEDEPADEDLVNSTPAEPEPPPDDHTLDCAHF